jgi:hypothetical protein
MESLPLKPLFHKLNQTNNKETNCYWTTLLIFVELLNTNIKLLLQEEDKN